MAQEGPSGLPKVIVFVSDGLSRRAALWTIAVAAFALAIITDRTIEPSAGPARTSAILVLVGCVLLLGIVRRWTVQIDPHNPRMTIFRLFVLRGTRIVLWANVIEHCSFDECSEVGTMTYTVGESDELRVDVVLDFKRGGRHRIPVQASSLHKANKLASELSATTGIPMQDQLRKAGNDLQTVSGS